jgi:hypothetical protein
LKNKNFGNGKGRGLLMEKKTMVMDGIATLNLMANTNNPERFVRLLNKHTIVDCNVSFLTCEGEVITINAFQCLDIQWKAEEPEFEGVKVEVKL